MRCSSPAFRFLSLAALAVPLLLGHPAMAQIGRGPVTPDAPPPTPSAPPSALPGLANRTAAPAIAPDANFNNLGPNEALFDSINRGDLGAARDAVTRGADLESRNVLGLTPLDSAVDQGRNEIAFFLLSARGPGRASPPPQPSGGTTASTRPTSPPRPLRVPPPQPTPRVAATPRQPPADGGAPRPDVGFLGFDAGRGG